MTTETTIALDVLAHFGDGGTPAEREHLRWMGAMAWAERREHGDVDMLASRAIAIGQKSVSAIHRFDDVRRVVDGSLREAALAALRSAFRAAGLS